MGEHNLPLNRLFSLFSSLSHHRYLPLCIHHNTTLTFGTGNFHVIINSLQVITVSPYLQASIKMRQSPNNHSKSR